MPTKRATLETLPDLLDRLAREGGRGRIDVGPDEPVARLWVDGRVIVDATSDSSDRRLGARLVSTGHAGAADLRKAERVAKAGGTPLIHALVGRVRADVLTSIARDEARYALAAALAVGADQIRFEPDATPSGTSCSIETDGLLVETRAFLAAIANAQAFAPPGATPNATALGSVDGGLTLEEDAVLRRCDGTRTVQGLADECGLPGPEVSLLIERLAGLGLVSLEDVSDAAALIAELEAVTGAATVIEASVIEEPPAMAEEPILIVEPEPLVEQLPIAAAVEEALLVSNAHVPVDTIALLRELSALSRDPDARRR